MKKYLLILLMSVSVYASCVPADISCIPAGEGSNCTFDTPNIEDCPTICGFVPGTSDPFSCNITGICYQIEIVPMAIYTTECEIYLIEESECKNNTFQRREMGITYNGLLNFVPPAQQEYVDFTGYQSIVCNSSELYGFGTGESEFNHAFIFFLQLLMIIFLLLVLYGMGYSKSKNG
jgi:hypothetical protein